MNKNILELSNFSSVSKEKYNPASGISFTCIELEHIEKETGILNGNTRSLLQASIKNKFDAGDVLFGKLRPNLRKYAQPDFDGVCSTEIWVLKTDPKKCSKDFLFYLVQSEKFIQTACKTTGSKMPRADWNLLSEEPFHLPSLPEQRKIAAILRTWDEAIEKLEKLISFNEKRLSLLTMNLIFGIKRFGKRQISERTKHKWISGPKDWSLVHIGNIAAERSQLNYDSIVHTVLSCSKHDGFVRSLDFFKKQIFSKDLKGYKLIRRGDFGFPSNHVEEGSIGLQNLEDIAVVSPIYIVCTPDAKVVDADFLFRLLKTKTYADIFRASTSSSVDRRGNLRWPEFSKIPLFLPDLTEQKEINSVLRQQQYLMEELEKYKIVLVSQKRGLMQKLLTGTWPVKTSEQEVASC
jgi:type I restriction enzyme S subunit